MYQTQLNLIKARFHRQFLLGCPMQLFPALELVMNIAYIRGHFERVII